MSLTDELARFVAPLSSSVATPEAALALLRELGLFEGPAAVFEVPEALADLAAVADGALEAIAALADEDRSAGEKVELAIEAVIAVLGALDDLGATASGSLDGLPLPFDSPHTWETLAAALPAHLLARWLRSYHPVAHATLRLTGAIADNGRGGASVDFDAVASVLADPAGHMRGIVADDPAVLLAPLRAIAAARGATPPSRRITFDGQTAIVDDEAPRAEPPGLDLSLATPTLGENWIVDATVEPVEVGGSPGLQLVASLLGSPAAGAHLSPTWTLTTNLAEDLPTGFALVPDGVRKSDANAADSASVTLAGAPATPWTLVGDADATRLELAGLTFELAGERLLASSPEVVASLRTDGLRLVVAPGDGDSFLADVLGGAELIADASLATTWSSVEGFSFGAGGPSFDVTIPIGLTVGPIVFQTLRIGLGADSDGLATEVAVTLGLVLGPIAVVVEDIGVSATIVPAPAGGHGIFGEVDFVAAFKTPNGLGLAVEAGVVTGGGFLTHDPDTGRYAGAAEINVVGTGLVAIGVVDTGADWSLFLSLGIRLVGVQLGFGFTLNGVGGLAAVNRGLDDDALGEAVRCGSLDSILFPEDVIASVPLILAEIDSVFPPMRGQYVFGPVVKIGWGTPTLAELDVGVAIQLPEPLTVSLLGSLQAVLPSADVPIVELHVNFAGTVDITEGTLKIDSSLTGSQVAGLLITGDMSVRSDFLGDPSFLLAFGGFNPQFVAPDDFPELQRLGVSLDTGDAFRVSLGGYFAVTSNTVQFGAHAELYAGGAGFSVEGGTSFDALITFQPFGFDIRLRVWVSVQAGNFDLLAVLLAGELGGPNPWHVTGVASFTIMGIRKHLEIEEGFGEVRAEEEPETTDPQALLRDALELDDAWSILDPVGTQPVLVSDPGDGLAVHPSGRVQVTQRIVPLDAAIEHFGNAELAGASSYSIEPVGFAMEDVEDVQEWFASGHYFRLDEDETLTAPSFTLMKAGVVVGGSDAEAPDPAELTFDHEIAYRDPGGRADAPRFTGRLVTARDEAMTRAIAGRTTAAPAARVTVRDAGWVVIDGDTAAATGAVAASGIGFFEARAELSRDGEVLAPAYELELTG